MTDNKKTLNDIESCLLFKDFIERINNWYGEEIAFRDYERKWTYREIYISARRLVPHFMKSKKKYCYIRIKSPVYFCIAFFSIIVSGKIVLLNSGSPDMEGIEVLTEKKLQDLLRVGYLCDYPEQKSCDDLAVIAQSSGTTSIVKSVMLSQRNLLSDTVSGMQLYDYPFGAVYYNVLPYSHLFGLVADMLGPLYSGGTICFSENKLNFFNDLQKFKPTHMNLPPAMVYTIEKIIQKTKNLTISTGGRLKKIMCAGAPLDQASQRELKKEGIAVYIAYGLTECSPCVSMNSEKYDKNGSAGKILPCCEVAIVDGEVIVRGDNVMLGYWNDLDATERTIQNGWLHTGDLGFLDDEGFLFLIGRKSNLIVFEDGTKLVPELLENELSKIDGIKESVVKKEINGIRTRIKIIVAQDENAGSKVLEAKIKDCVKKQGYSDRLCEIHVTKKELPKNKLGKIIRANII